MESEIGHLLPPDFEAFLLRHSEGLGILAGFLTCPLPDGRRLSVHKFYDPHLRAAGPRTYIGHYYRKAWENGPKDLLPFARGGGGRWKPNLDSLFNEYCVGLAGERLGRIYLAEPAEDLSSYTITGIAPSIDAFLDGLRREDADDDGRFARLGGFALAFWGRNSRAIRPDDIEKAEAEIGHTLPESFKHFLLSHPFGPISFRRGAQFPLPEGSPLMPAWSHFSVFSFYRVCPAEDGLGLPEIYRKEQEFVPSRFLPIGNNGLGDLVCIELDGGAIVVWNHELYDYDNDEPTEESITPVAPSFEAFLEMLQPSRDA